MARPGLIIRSQDLGGKQVVLGTDAARGIVVEQPSFQADAFGPSGGTFTLKRDPRVQWPDLRAYAPIIVEQRGLPVWRGRIRQTPMTDGGLARQISVNCEGQQFHLDDDPYDRMYVATNLADWKDIRSSLQAVLGEAWYAAGATVSAGGGGVTLQWPKSLPIATGSTMGVYFDAGPGNLISQFSIDLTSSGNSSANLLYVRGYSDPYFPANYTPQGTAFEGGANNVYPGPYSLNGVLTTPCRYLAIFDYCNLGYTPSADVWWKFTGIRLFALPAYAISTLTAGTSSTSALPVTSALCASDVVLDALSRATLIYSPDRSLITTTSFFIPELTMTGPSTPREVVAAANNYHGYQFRVRADNRPEFRPLPALPTIEVGADSRFDEASAGDASEIYTTVIVEYTDAAGEPQRMQRSQPSSLFDATPIQPSNPGFETNLTGWTSITGVGDTVARDTVQKDTGVASLKYTGLAGGFLAVGTQSFVGGALLPGASYRLSFSLRTDTAIDEHSTAYVQDTNGANSRITLGIPVGYAVNQWIPFVIDLKATSTALYGISFANVKFAGGAAGNLWLDSFVFTVTRPTLVDRWGFKRTKVLPTNMMLTDAAAEQIASVFLAAHRATPLKGKLTVTGDSRARRSPSGAGMTCAELLACVGDLVRMRHLVDPDTGKLGRIGRIAAATWDADSNTVTLEIDSTSTNFEALLARLAIVTGQVRA